MTGSAFQAKINRYRREQQAKQQQVKPVRRSNNRSIAQVRADEARKIERHPKDPYGA